MKRFWFMLIALVATCFLVACSGSQGVSTKTIKENKKIVVATESEFAPFEFKSLVNGKDTLVGADIELAKAIGKKLGVKVEFSVMSFDNVLASVQSGKADIAIAGISVTDERKKVYDFSDSYYTSNQAIILKKDSKIKKLSQLEGKKVGVQEGTTGDIIASGEKFGEKNKVIVKTDVKRYKKGVDAVMDLKNGAIDAVVIDEKPAQEFVKNNAKKLKLVVDSAGAEYYCIAITKGNTAYKEEINKQIKAIKKDGTYDKLKAKYIDSAN